MKRVILLLLIVLGFNTVLMAQENSKYSKQDAAAVLIPTNVCYAYAQNLIKFLGLNDGYSWIKGERKYVQSIGYVNTYNKTLYRRDEGKEEKYEFLLGIGPADYYSALTVIVSYNGERIFEPFPSPDDPKYSTLVLKEESVQLFVLSSEWQRGVSMVIRLLGLNEFPSGKYPTENCIATSWEKTGSYLTQSMEMAEVWEKTITRRDDQIGKKYVFQVRKTPSGETAALDITTSYVQYVKKGEESTAKTEVQQVEGQEDTEIIKEEEAQTLIGQINGHDYVDLGLSVKWANCNVGADSPSDYGYYFAWAETATKSSYTSGNSLTLNKDIVDIAGNPQYDAAYANWGGTWRLPSKEEIDELYSKCNRKWMTKDGHPGYEITGPNGNSIFLPAGGWYEGTTLNYAGEQGAYWSSTVIDYEEKYGKNCNPKIIEASLKLANTLDFGKIPFYQSWFKRYSGRSVRPVSE